MSNFFILSYAIFYWTTLQIQWMSSSKLSFTSPLPLAIKANKRNVSTSQRQELTLLAFINYGGHFVPFGPICTQAMQLALDALVENSSLSLFDRYDLTIKPFDDKCSRPDGVPLFVRTITNVDQIANVFPLALTSVCAVTDITAKMLHHFNFVGLASATVNERMFNDRKMYESFYTTVDILKNVHQMLAQFFEANNWKKVALVSDDESYWFALEKRLSAELEARSIFLLGSIKIPSSPGKLPDELTIKAAVEELKWMDPRIIIIHSTIPPLIACWLHKAEMYGPYYAIFIYGGLYFRPNVGIRYSWCNEEMLYEVLQSVIFFGDGEFFKFGTSQRPDSQGMTAERFDSELQARITSPDANPFWEFTRTTCYDLVATAAYLLDATDRTLRKRNQTLSDWMVNDENFQRYGRSIATAIGASLQTVKFRGILGDLDFTENTINSANSFPVLFQLQNNSEVKNGSKIESKNLKVVIVAHHNSQRNATLIYGPGTVKWQTFNLKAPPDSTKILRIRESTFPYLIALILIGMGSLLVTFQLGFLILFCITIWTRKQLVRFRKSTCWLYAWLVFGNILMNLFVVTLLEEISELKSKQQALTCSLGLLFLMVGYSLSSVCPGLLLELGLDVLLRKRARLLRLANRISDVSGGNSAIRRTEILTNKARTVFVIWLTLGIILATGLLLQNQVGREILLTTFQRSTVDLTTAYQFYIDRCDLTFPEIYTKEFGAVTAWLIMHGVATSRMAFLSFYLRKKTIHEVARLPAVCSACYYNIFAVLAGCAVVTIFYQNRSGDIRLPVAIVCLFNSICNLVLIFVRNARPIWRPMATKITTVDEVSRSSSRPENFALNDI